MAPQPPPPPAGAILTGDPEHDAEERAFFRLYGDWLHTTPAEAAALLDGYPKPWWISGGWAIEAFTGVSRAHDDVDVTIFRSDVGALRRHFADTHHLWSAGSGTIAPLTDQRPRIPRWAGQIWVREHALAPWLIDVVVNQGKPGGWIFKRDPSYVRPLDEVTWVAPDGLRYLKPEIALAHKAALLRRKDGVDLAMTLPLLDADAVTWLRDFLVKCHPEHVWLAQL